MASGYHSTSNDCTYDTIALGDTTFWPNTVWPTEQLDHQPIPYFNGDSGMPRSVQRDLVEMDLALANDIGFGPTGAIPLADEIPTFNFDYHFSPVPMARTTSDISGHRLNPTRNQLRHASIDGTNRKRHFHQIDMAFSSSYPSSAAPWPSTGTMNATQQSHLDDVQVYEPGDYCSKLANEASAMHFAAKKQRVEGFDESRPFAQSSTYALNMCVPSAPDVAPSAGMSTSMSTHHLSPCSLTSSEAMSRQSSVSSASVTDAFDMMRVESSFSTASDLFPLDQIDGSFVSCVTEKPDSRQSTTGLNNGSVGYVSMNPFSFHGHKNLSAAAVGGGQSSPRQAGETHSAAEEGAPNNDSTELKASERRRKHIENSRKSIAPKSSHQNPSPVTTRKQSPKQSHVNKAANPSTASKPKEAISKTPYVRPQHPKLYCNMCDDSGGFRGEHELRRHWDREHATSRKVWICLQPTTRTEWWPAKPLSSCKQCKQQKQYNVYYNAAAHLRRAHFCPRKRGRKAKGEERESRAGKAGGDWPPIDWLKANGWLKEIEVSSVSMATSPEKISKDTPLEANTPVTPHDDSFTQPAALPAAQHFHTHYLPGTDPILEQPTMQWHDSSYPIDVKETPCFPSTAAMSLYVANGYAF